MAGYVRQEAANIVDANTISASHFNNEYNAIAAAFSATTGHAHDGTTAEGPPIEVIGPAQEFVASSSSLSPKTTNTYSLGTTSLRYSSGWFQGVVTAAGGFAGALTGNVTGNVTGNLTGNVTGDVTGNVTGNVTGDITGDLTGNVTGNVTGNLTGNVTGNASTATTLQTSRNIILAGDASGSAAFNGSANATITVTVADDSHTHDTRYYTETESDARFLGLAGGTMTGALTLSGAPSSNLHAATKLYVDSSVSTGVSSYLPLAGGTLTGDTTIQKANPSFTLRGNASGEARRLRGFTGASIRWSVNLGTTATESGANAGSNFSIESYDDSGTLLHTPLSINRASGDVTIAKDIFVTEQIQAGDTGHYLSFGSGSTIYAWDADDYLAYNRAGNTLSIIIGTNTKMSVSATGVSIATCDFTARPTLNSTGFGVNMSATTSLSGTSVDITGIPSNVRRVTVLFKDLSVATTTNLRLQVGDGAVVTSGYASAHAAFIGSGVGTTSATAGIDMNINSAAQDTTGAYTLELADAATNLWVARGICVGTTNANASFCSGFIALSGALDRIRLTTTNGTYNFDNGTVTVTWEV